MLRRYSDQAAVHDASTSTGGRNPRPARSVNVMELCFDDGMIEQDDNGYENYTHECDFETSIDQIMVNMNDISNKGNPRRNGPRLVRMDIATWKSLTDGSNRMGQRSKKERVRSLITTSSVPTIATVTPSFATTTSGMPTT
jgi:hypothetical protein